MKLLACLLGLLMPAALHAQWDYGMEVGLNAGAPIPEKMVTGAKGQPGVQPVLGLFAVYSMKRRIDIQASLYFDSKTASYSSPVAYPYIVVSGDSIDSFSGKVKGKFSNRYLSLPIFVFYKLGHHWSVGAGGYFSYLLRGSNKGQLTEGKAGFNGMFAIDDRAFDESSQIHSIDYGLNIGLKYQIRKYLKLQWFVAYGLQSVTKASDNFKDKTHNTYTYLTLGYGF